MDIYHKICKGLVGLLCVAALWAPAHATSDTYTLPETLAPLDIEGTYYFSWAGIPFAKLWLNIDDDGTQYTLTSAFKSRGIVRIFQKMKSLSTSHGIADEQGTMHALSFAYETDPDISEQKKTELTFDESGILTSRLVDPEDDPWHRPPIPAEDVVGASTPGNLLWDLRRALYDAIRNQQSQFSLLLYDGQRLSRINAELLGIDYFRINDDTKIKSYKLALARDLINGFTHKEITRHANGEPTAYLYVSADDVMIPIGTDVDIKLGTLRGVWQPQTP